MAATVKCVPNENSDHRRRKRSRCSLNVGDWPTPDRELWDQANRPGSKLRAGGMAAKLAISSKLNMMRGYGAWLFWLAATGRLCPDSTPERRLTESNLDAYVAHLQDYLSEISVAMQIDKLHQAVRAMMPQDDFSMLATLARNLIANATPSNTKAARLVHAGDLFEFGLRLMRAAEEAENATAVRCAVMFRDGLLIAFLAARPQRKRNVGGMELGTTLVRENDRYWLHFVARETKTKRPIQLPCPTGLTKLFDRYFAVYRPLLRARATTLVGRVHNAVWISSTGAPMNAMAIYRVTTRRTLAEFGKSVNPHLFRDCAATTIALDDPTCVQIIMHVLGHSRIATSEYHYNQARGFEAGRSLIALIEDQRSGSSDALHRKTAEMPEFPHKRLGNIVGRVDHRR